MPSITLGPGEHDVPAGCIASVVTHLCKDVCPAEIDPALPMGLRLEWTRDMSVVSYKALFEDIGGCWLWFSQLSLEDAELEAKLRSADTHLGIAYDHHSAIGFIEIDSTDIETICVSFLGLKPGYEGRGIGRSLLETGLAKALHPQSTSIATHTCTLDHPGALDFYQKHGFRAVKQTIEIAPDPRQSGLLAENIRPNYPIL